MPGFCIDAFPKIDADSANGNATNLTPTWQYEPNGIDWVTVQELLQVLPEDVHLNLTIRRDSKLITKRVAAYDSPDTYYEPRGLGPIRIQGVDF